MDRGGAKVPTKYPVDLVKLILENNYFKFDGKGL